MAKKKQKLYLGRRQVKPANEAFTPADDNPYYEIGTNVNRFGPGGWGITVGYVYSFCPKEFEQVTGVTLKPGEVVEIRIVKGPVVKTVKPVGVRDG